MAGFSAPACHNTRLDMGFIHTEEVTQLLGSAGYRERRRPRVVVMAPSQTMDRKDLDPWKKKLAQRSEVTHSHLTTGVRSHSIRFGVFVGKTHKSRHPRRTPPPLPRVALSLRITLITTFIIINMTIRVGLRGLRGEH